MLLGARCAGCGAAGEVVCAACSAQLAPPPALPVPLHVDEVRALCAYDDASRPLLLALKNRDRRDGVAWLAARLAHPRPVGGVVTWAPTSDVRRRHRGFDQAELLARALARRWGLPVRALLRRQPGPPQSGRTRRERRRNPGFGARTPRVPRSVVLVDDVATTGATLTAAARALRQAGAEEVRAVVAALAGRPLG